jgi:hypothetical protein
MSDGWLVKGYHTGPNSKQKGIFTKKGQYVVDALDLAREAVQAGCDEVIILKRGGRSAGVSRGDYNDRVQRTFAVDSGAARDEVKP